ncbi:MAG: hypothetical protein ACTSRJ_03950, partial [Candidatus Hodarchaeales archaeon]
MSLPFTLNSPQEWLDKIPTFLISLNTSTEYGLSNNTPVYIASKLVLYFNHSPQQFGRKIVEILTNASDTGKFVLLKILLRGSPIWADLIKIEGVQPALTELALTTDKMYSIYAIDLSKKLDEITSVVKHDIFSLESIPALEEEPFTEDKIFEE